MSLPKYALAAVAAACVAGSASAQYGPNGRWATVPPPNYPSVFSSTPLLNPNAPAMGYPAYRQAPMRNTYRNDYRPNRFGGGGYAPRWNAGGSFNNGYRGWYR